MSILSQSLANTVIIQELGLKTRVLHKLMVAGLFTTEQLLLCSEYDLLHLRGLGGIGLKNVIECLEQHNLGLKCTFIELVSHQRVTHEERFWSKVNKTETCWLWTGHCNCDGYGEFSICGVRILAHRASYLLEYGMLPEGLSVLHSCDNPPCIRPTHLFLGTQQDNVNDMIAKGRANFNRAPKSLF
jgi:hypothetical protein